MKSRCARSLIALWAVALASAASADVYRCTDGEGQLKFSDQPCDALESEERLDIETGNEDEDTGPVLPPNAGEMLREAARRGDTAQVIQLIDLGVKVNDRDQQGMTALHRAGHRLGRLDVVRTLVEAGADVNARALTGETVLERSIYRLEIAEYLLEQGARVNLRNSRNGSSVLHAVVRDPVAADGIIEFLLEAGADIDIRDNEGNTPLHAATWRADDPIATMTVLLKGGAWVNAKNDAGQTPLDLAESSSRENIRQQIIDLLMEHGARRGDSGS